MSIEHSGGALVVDTGRDGRTWDFFVSYTAADRRWAEWVAWQLEDAGYRVLIQAWDFVPGSDWMFRMDQGVRHARKMIALLSPAYLVSVYGGEEWRAVRAADPTGFARKLLPVRIRECERPGLLRTVVGFDLFGLSPDEARAHLLTQVGHSLSGRAKPVNSPEFPIPPRDFPAITEPEFPILGQETPAQGEVEVVIPSGGEPAGPHEIFSEDRWDLFVSYAAADRTWANWITTILQEAGYRVLTDQSDGTTSLSTISAGISAASSTVAVLSASYLRSVYGRAEWESAWSSDPDGVRRSLIPVRIEECGRPGIFEKIISVDVFGVTEAEARDTLLTSVRASIEGRAKPELPPRHPESIPDSAVNSEQEELRIGALTRFPGSRPSQIGQKGRQRKVGYVFRPTDIPDVTFVQPERFTTFGMYLRQPGLSLVVEGPSGIGKTTLLRHAISRYSSNLGDPKVYSARVPADVVEIDRILTTRTHAGIVAIDDFHHLSSEQQARAVDYLKQLSDVGDSTGKLVLVGIPYTAQSLVTLSFDIANRIRKFHLSWATDRQIHELIDKGEKALNISFDDRAAIVKAASGSLITAQSLCWHLTVMERIEETLPELAIIPTLIPEAQARVTDELRIKYHDAVEAFAALDESNQTVCIDLLLGLARSRDGVLYLREDTYGTAALNNEAERTAVGATGPLAAINEEPAISRHLYYDDRGSRLIADDPQFLFYIKQLDRQHLLRTIGKRVPMPRRRTFVCYSHTDQSWLTRLLVHLKPLQRDGLIEVWSDREIRPGNKWRTEIDAALASARIAVLLVSADFLASDFIQDVEIPRILEASATNGCRVIPVLVRASAFNNTPAISMFQAINPGLRTLASLPDEAAEQILADLAETIANEVYPKS